jgi:prevent-host-death family protein
MPKTISVSEAKNRLSAMLNWAQDNQDEVIVESRGQPKAVILPYSECESFLTLREKARRQDAIRRLQELAAMIQDLDQDLTEEGADRLADEIARESLTRMAAEGKVAFD